MKKKSKVFLIVSWLVLFLVVFAISALFRVQALGSAPMKLLKVDWNDSVGKKHENLPYENICGHKYDLYMPANLNTGKANYLILFIHGGSFNSGTKEDGDFWCKYYTEKGYVTATLNYSLQTKQKDASLITMNREINNCVIAIKEKCLTDFGILLNGMATCGVSAGGTLAMNYAYTQSENSPIPIKFVFQLAGPADFEPDDWNILIKTNKLKSKAEFATMMTGVNITDDMIISGEYNQFIDKISPARLVNSNTVPSLVGYGLKDHLVPASSRILLKKAFDDSGIMYDYLEFPNCNHGMYRDLDKLQLFLDKSLAYCNNYFK